MNNGQEQIKFIRSSLLYGKASVQSVVITSAQSGDGKSYTSLNLAKSLAEAGRKVLLIDGDMRKGMLTERLKCTEAYGLSDYLEKKELEIGSILASVPFRSKHTFQFIPSGSLKRNPTKLLLDKPVDSFLDQVKPLWDFIIFDTPPVALVTDAQLLATKVDGVIVIVRKRHTQKELLVKSKSLLERARILGVVYNRY